MTPIWFAILMGSIEGAVAFGLGVTVGMPRPRRRVRWGGVMPGSEVEIAGRSWTVTMISLADEPWNPRMSIDLQPTEQWRRDHMTGPTADQWTVWDD